MDISILVKVHAKYNDDFIITKRLQFLDIYDFKYTREYISFLMGENYKKTIKIEDVIDFSIS